MKTIIDEGLKEAVEHTDHYRSDPEVKVESMTAANKFFDVRFTLQKYKANAEKRKDTVTALHSDESHELETAAEVNIFTYLNT